MDRQYIRDANVIERYLQGKLTAAEEEAFEEAYLADSAVLDELQLAERLQQGLQALDAGKRVERRARPADWLKAAASPRYAMAASVVAAIALMSSGWLYVQNLGLRDGNSRVVAGTTTRLLPLLSVRGSNANLVDAPAEDEWTVLLLDAGFADYDRYRAVLTRRNAAAVEELLRLDEMTPTYEGMLALGLPGRLLVPGDYEIQLAGRMRDWPPERAFDDLSRIPLSVAPRP